VHGLTIGADRNTLRWTAVSWSGGDAPVYDVLRTTAAADFGAGATCVGTDVTDLYVTDADVPAPGSVHFWVVRAENACGGGSAGLDGGGAERVVRACP